MKTTLHWNLLASVVAGVIALSACTSKLATPPWQGNAFSALKGFTSDYLSGNTRLAEFQFSRARSEMASTGRADLVARAELTRCATRVASLEFDNCAGYQPLAQDAGAPEQAYAAYLTGQWTGLNAALLPEQHRAVVLNAASGKLDAIEDPLARLVAAGTLLQVGQLTPADISSATETASSQGWRRPLLAWLGVQLKRAEAAGEKEAAARLQRRVDLVLQAPAKTQ
jgi:hypothetical protein